ncbi:MAG: hypothetical protein AAGD14_16845 [Planctomycetota bacterium]
MRWVTVLLVAAVLCGCAQTEDLRQVQEAIESVIRTSFELNARERQGDEPELRTVPNDPGHLVVVAGVGEQRHYFSEDLQCTYVFGSYDVNGEILEARIIGAYAGPPPYRGGKLELYPPPAILLVEAPKNWSVVVKEAKGSYAATSSRQAEPRRFELQVGRYLVQRRNAFLWFDGKAHSIELEAGCKTTLRLDR